MIHREYVVQDGIDIYRIALEAYGDASRWQEIVQYNGLTHPYITDDMIGSTILIPMTPDEAFAEPVSTDTWLDILCGEDLDIEHEDLEVNEGDAGSLIGLGNMRQAIIHRLTTYRGELPHHPEYGSLLEDMVGRTEPFIDKKIRLNIIETLNQDDRIESISIQELKRTDQTVECSGFVSLVGQSTRYPIHFSLDFR